MDDITVLEIISDKSLEDFKEAGLSSQIADNVLLETSANYIIDDYLFDEISVKRFYVGDTESDYYFNGHDYITKSTDGKFRLTIDFPISTEKVILVLSGEDMVLWDTWAYESEVNTVGFTLSNGNRVFCMMAFSDTTHFSISGSGDGAISVIYLCLSMNFDQQVTLSDDYEVMD